MILDSIVSGISLVVIATWIWSIKAHFKSTEMPAGAKLISALVIASAVFLLFLVWRNDQPVQAKVAGIVLQLLSYALFWAAIGATRSAALLAAFTPLAPHSLVTSGPYRFVRHPFYSSYLLFWVGLAICTWSVWALVPLTGMFVTYLQAAMDEERKFGQTALAKDYSQYMAKTARFIPGVF
jgi:protein-S-isoprenylcysteine O-methyltransferase Ste14